MALRLQGYTLNFVCAAVGLWICGRFVPGVVLSVHGLVIATLLIGGIETAEGLWMDHWKGREAPWKTGLGCITGLVLMPSEPGLADWVTPGFNIDGGWQYVVVFVVILLAAAASYYSVELVKQLSRDSVRRWRA